VLLFGCADVCADAKDVSTIIIRKIARYIFLMNRTVSYSITCQFALARLLIAAAQFPPSGIQLLDELIHQFG
jgi:hypothetical protein